MNASGVSRMISVSGGAAIIDPFTEVAANSEAIAVRELNPKSCYRYSILFPISRPRSGISTKFAEILERVARRTGETCTPWISESGCIREEPHWLLLTAGCHGMVPEQDVSSHSRR